MYLYFCCVFHFILPLFWTWITPLASRHVFCTVLHVFLSDTDFTMCTTEYIHIEKKCKVHYLQFLSDVLCEYTIASKKAIVVERAHQVGPNLGSHQPPSQASNNDVPLHQHQKHWKVCYDDMKITISETDSESTQDYHKDCLVCDKATSQKDPRQ